MALIQFDRVSLAFGEHWILDKAGFTIESGERVCLIGRNGAGKSTLFKLLVGEIEPDDGEIRYTNALRISRLQQTLPHELDETVFNYVKGGLSFLQSCIDQYQQLSAGVQGKSGLRELENLQHLIEAGGGWRIDNQVETILTELQLPGDRKLGELSGGWQRRASLGRALVSQPELLLLDEPTNHLDLSAIRWLEDRVFAFQGSILFVTHDRAFLQRLATRILELDRGRLTSWPGSFKKFLVDKEKLLEDEAIQNALFDKQLQQEESWIRQGIKARRTRNEGRVRALEKMREEYARRVKPQDQVRIHVEEGDVSGRKVIDARKIDYSYSDENLIQGLSLKIQRGDRVGLIGNNGVGKSTLLKILLGEIQPKAGTVKQGTNLQIAYFDQGRQQLDPERTAAEIVGDGSEYIKVNGKEQHIIGYLKGFLFSPERSKTRVKVLSGGECNRIILAKLFTRPSNLLILDEPTNDLDVETLEVLEQRLCDYNGTLIVVSHDREFLDNVVTSTVVFEAGGNIQVYAGGYSDWLKQGKALGDESERHTAAVKDTGPSMTQPVRLKPGKLSYKLQRELDRLPNDIELLEKEVGLLQQRVGHQDFYNQPYEDCQTVLDQLAEREAALERLLQRWGELETLSSRR